MRTFSFFILLLITFHTHILAEKNFAEDEDFTENIEQDSTQYIEFPANSNPTVPNSEIYSIDPPDQYLYSVVADINCIFPITSQHFLSVRRNQGRSIFSRKSYTTLEAFSFQFQDENFYPFFDLRFHQFDNTRNAVSTGLGFRYLNPCSQTIFGVNAFYDYRRACKFNFHQFGVGFEFFGEIFNFRLNGYLPLGKQSHRCSFCLFDDYDGGYFVLEEKFIDCFKGVNFEIEAAKRDYCGNRIALAIGPYYYNRRKGCRKNIYGSTLRLSTELWQYFTFTILASYDNVFKGRVQGQIGVVLPLYFQKTESSICSHIGNINQTLFQPLQRNDTILIKSHRSWRWNF